MFCFVNLIPHDQRIGRSGKKPRETFVETVRQLIYYQHRKRYKINTTKEQTNALCRENCSKQRYYGLAQRTSRRKELADNRRFVCTIRKITKKSFVATNVNFRFRVVEQVRVVGLSARFYCLQSSKILTRKRRDFPRFLSKKKYH